MLLEQPDLGQIPLPQPGEYAMPNSQFGSSIVTLTSPSSDLYDLELTLRGMYEDANGKLVQAGDALCNEQGIIAIMGLTKSIVSRITILSNLKDGNIEGIIMRTLDTTIRLLLAQGTRYGIKNKMDKSLIVFNVTNTCFITMQRALEEGDRRFWKGSQQNIRTEVVSSAQPKKNWVSQFTGWGK